MDKQCRTCKEFKTINSYGKNRNACLDCDNKRKREHYQKNKDIILETKKDFYKNNKEKISLRKKEYYENNRKDILNQKKSYHIKNQQVILEKHKEYYQENKEEIIEKSKAYNQKNKEKIKPRKRKYWQERMKKDSLFKIKHSLRGRTSSAFKTGYPKSKKTLDLIGCPWENLKEHLEAQFTEGMTWENYGLYGWHVDHIMPLSSAKTLEEIEALCHYTNLQPLWAEDNLKKGDSIIDRGLNKK